MFSRNSFWGRILATGTNNETASAIGWLMLGMSGGLCLDLCAKEILRHYPLSEFVLLRSVVALMVFLILTPRLFGGWQQLGTRRWRWHALRSVLAIGAMYGFFFGLARMPLVNALTLGFTAPLMVTALARLFLGECIGWRRWLGVFAGFCGVLVMLRPGSGQFDLPSAAILFAALCYASQAITARHLGTTESTLSLTVYVIAGPLLVALLLTGTETWVQPDTRGWLLMAAAGACSVIAWVGLVAGYRRASPSVLAPLEYLALVGGAIAGYLIWDEVPDRWVVTGAAIIVASGLFVVYREIDNNADIAGTDETTHTGERRPTRAAR